MFLGVAETIVGQLLHSGVAVFFSVFSVLEIHCDGLDQGHPMTVFCKISVWRSKDWLEFSTT